MYKLLLCSRYLRTRYIALASVVSVTLGVATMIVVNSVMSGFKAEMQDRIHGILSDVILESRNIEGFPDAPLQMDRIRQVAGDEIDGMTATCVTPAMLTVTRNGITITRQIQLVGIDPQTQGQVSDFSNYLQHPANRRNMSFRLREEGYDVVDHQAVGAPVERPQMEMAGWSWRRRWAEAEAWRREYERLTPDGGSSNDAQRQGGVTDAIGVASTEKENRSAAEASAASGSTALDDPFAVADVPELQEDVFDPLEEQHTGLVLGIAMVSRRDRIKDARTGEESVQDQFFAIPGDDVRVSMPTAGMPPKIVSDKFTVVDMYESKMSEYDETLAFVPIEKVQKLRGMIDPASGQALVNQILIKAKPGVDLAALRDKLQERFSQDLFVVSTWRDKQGALLAAVQMETAILNVLLFLIIAVAGFGILAIFFMIVIEKTRDIGILKAIGASGTGIMQIFLGYGLLLGLVGAGAGMVLGLVFVTNINGIADVLGMLTGQPVFDPEIYYFYEIPTIVSPLTVILIMLGAMAVAVSASVLPAWRASRMHPVEALRYE